MTLSTIRPLEHTLHSYLHPLGLELLPPTLDASVGLATGLVGRGAPIQAMIEPQCVAFFAAVAPKSHLTPLTDAMYRLTCPDGPAVESVHEVDVRTEDLLRYTNAEDDIGYAILLTDLAASAGALSVLVMRDPYFQVPLALLAFPVCRPVLTNIAAESGPALRRVPRDPPDRHGEAPRLRRHGGLVRRGRRGPVRPPVLRRVPRAALRRRGHRAGPEPGGGARVPGLCPALRVGPVRQGLRPLDRRREPGITYYCVPRVCL